MHTPLRPAPTGFTLLEVLVALVLLSVFTVTTWRSLDAVLTAEAHARADLSAWQGMARSLARLEGDLENAQAVGKPPFQGDSTRLNFTRAYPDGRLEPLYYQFAKDRLLRSARGATAQPVIQALKQGEWHYLNPQGAWQSHWPPPNNPAQADALPRAVAFDFVTAQGTALRRVFRVQ